MAKRTKLEREVDAEIIAKGKDAIKDFDHTKAITVPAKPLSEQRKRCPFCGTKRLAISGGQVNCKCGCCKHSVVCETCGAVGPTADDWKQAFELWNTRRAYERKPQKPWSLADIRKSGRWV